MRVVEKGKGVSRQLAQVFVVDVAAFVAAFGAALVALALEGGGYDAAAMAPLSVFQLTVWFRHHSDWWVHVEGGQGFWRIERALFGSS